MALLIVDDEPLNRELLSRILAKEEYGIQCAGNVDEALLIMEESGSEIQLILCDQLMPGRPGTDLAREVKSRWPNTIFFLLTGYDELPEIQAAISEGVVDKLIVKPWKVKLLRAAITEMLSDQADQD